MKIVYRNLKWAPAFLVALMLCFFPIPGHASMKLSLEKALSLAENAPAINVSSAQVNEAKAQLSQAKGMFLPMVTASHQVVRTNDPVHVFGAKMQQSKFSATDFNINTLNSPAALTHTTTQVQFVQPILNGAVDIYNFKAAKHNVSAQEHAHNYNKAFMRLNVRSLYYQARSLDEKIAVNNIATSKLRELEKSYELIQAPTSANTTNYFVAQSIRKSLEAQKTYFVATMKNAKRTLLAMIGLDPEQEVLLTSALSQSSKKSLSKKEKREDVLSSEQTLLAAQNNLKANKWTYSPRLDFVSSYNVYSGDYESSSDSYMVGLNVSWPLFQGWRHGLVKQAKAQKDMARQYHDMISYQAKSGEKNAKQSVRASRQQLSQMKEAVLQATKALNLAKTRYDEGTLPLFDYSQSIQNWTTIKHAAIDTHLGLQVARSQVLFERGEK